MFKHGKKTSKDNMNRRQNIGLLLSTADAFFWMNCCEDNVKRQEMDAVEVK